MRHGPFHRVCGKQSGLGSRGALKLPMSFARIHKTDDARTAKIAAL